MGFTRGIGWIELFIGIIFAIIAFVDMDIAIMILIPLLVILFVLEGLAKLRRKNRRRHR